MGDTTKYAGTGENCNIVITAIFPPVNKIFWKFSCILFEFVSTQILKCKPKFCKYLVNILKFRIGTQIENLCAYKPKFFIWNILKSFFCRVRNDNDSNQAISTSTGIKQSSLSPCLELLFTPFSHRGGLYDPEQLRCFCRPHNSQIYWNVLCWLFLPIYLLTSWANARVKLHSQVHFGPKRF